MFTDLLKIEPCLDCDSPEFCGGNFCLRKTVMEDNCDSDVSNNLNLVEMPSETINLDQPLSHKAKEFITTKIFH